MAPYTDELLDVPRFTRAEVMRVAGLTSAQLKNTLDRDLVRLHGGNNPGTGRRRLFTGGDVLKLTAAHTLSGIGFPLRWFYLVADEIHRRAQRRSIEARLGVRDITGFGVVMYPLPDGDWMRVPFHDDEEPPSDLPPAVQVLRVDALIDRVRAKLEDLAAGEEPPSFPDEKAPEPPVPYGPENDFFRAWTKDAAGNDVLVGLNFEETREYEAHVNSRFGNDSRPRDEVETDRDRYLELHGRHEAARHARLTSEFRARFGTPEGDG